MNSASGNQRHPRVSIGVPVYNGEEYLEEVLDSIVTQIYTDFELLICDNASTDRTPEICREFLERDGRVKYFRNDENIGASRNHNKVFQLSVGEYFEWASADNVLTPTYVERCVEMLDEDPSLVLAFSRCTVIDEFNKTESNYESEYPLDSPDACERLRQLFIHVIGMNDPIFGLIRSSALRSSGLFKSYIGADDGLLIELVLKGRFGLVPEYLMRLRSHPNAYHAIKKKKADRKEDGDEATWFDPVNKNRAVYPHWRRMREYALAISSSKEVGSGEKLRMLGFLGKVAWWRKHVLMEELLTRGRPRPPKDGDET